MKPMAHKCSFCLKDLRGDEKIFSGPEVLICDERVEGSMWHVYILKCSNGNLYTGLTSNLNRRYDEHQNGKGKHYTSRNKPSELLYTETFKNKLQAEKREIQIKKWSKDKKQALIKGDLCQLINLSKSKKNRIK